MPPSDSARRQIRPLARWNLRLLVLVAALLALESGLAYLGFIRYRDDFLAERRAQLESIAALESARLSQWLAERMADAEALARDAEFGAVVKDALRRGTAADVPAVRNRLHVLQQAYGYSHVTLATADGRIVASTDAAMATLQPGEREAVRQALRDDAVVASNLHRTESSAHDMDLVAPLHAGAGEGLPVAVLLEIATDRLLAPREPARVAGSAETLLVRVVGGEAHYLSPLRHASPGLRRSLRGQASDFLAAQAARGVRGPASGADYRGVPVVAAIASVPGTDWVVLAKVDAAELDSLIRYRASLAVTVFLTMLLLMASRPIRRCAGAKRQPACLHARIAPVSRRSSIPRTTPSSAATSIASSPRGTRPPSGCSATPPRKRLAGTCAC